MNLCNSPVFFLLVWGISTAIYQSLGGYWSSVISTVEEIYHLSSVQSGFLSSADYFMSIWFSLPLVYHGQSCHRPRFMCLISVTKAFGALIQTFPHFFYKSSIDQFLGNHTEGNEKEVFQLCSLGNSSEDLSASAPPECGDTVVHNALFSAPVIWFIIGRMMTSSYNAMFPVAVVYLDDGLPKRSTVAYVGVISTVYAIGFTGGYFLAAICLRVPVIRIKLPKGIDVERLPGAWWLGYLILSILALVSSFLYLLFPAALPPPSDEEVGENQELLPAAMETSKASQDIGGSVLEDDSRLGFSGRTSPSNSENQMERENGKARENIIKGFRVLYSGMTTFCAAMKNIITNRVVVLLGISCGTFFFGTESFAVFTPLFVEKHYNLSPSTASILAGGQAILGYVTGQLSGAFLIRHFDFNRLECAYIYFGGLFLCTLFVTTGLFIVCPEEEIVGFASDKRADIELMATSLVVSECSAHCGCSDVFQPVCAAGVSYMSSCLVGCQEFSAASGIQTFYNCSCVPDSQGDQFGPSTATAGLCGAKCPAWLLFGGVGVLTCFVMSATGNATIVMILRSVEKPERALTFTFINIMVRVLGFIPGPIVFGWIMDQACLITTGTPCQEDDGGNCLLYDKARLRNLYFGVPAAVFLSTFVPTIMIIVTIWRQDKIGR